MPKKRNCILTAPFFCHLIMFRCRIPLPVLLYTVSYNTQSHISNFVHPFFLSYHHTFFPLPALKLFHRQNIQVSVTCIFHFDQNCSFTVLCFYQDIAVAFSGSDWKRLLFFFDTQNSKQEYHDKVFFHFPFLQRCPDTDGLLFQVTFKYLQLLFPLRFFSALQNLQTYPPSLQILSLKYSIIWVSKISPILKFGIRNKTFSHPPDRTALNTRLQTVPQIFFNGLIHFLSSQFRMNGFVILSIKRSISSLWSDFFDCRIKFFSLALLLV